LQHGSDYKHQAEYTTNVPDYTTLHVQLSAPEQMSTLSMLKLDLAAETTVQQCI